MGTSIASTELATPPRQATSKQERRRLPLLQQYLDEQSRLSAVERFSELHERGFSERRARYEALLPARSPRTGEQYAFRVDLDRCTGCKACVTACHSLNGLDEGETWRSVGLIVGGAAPEPFQQTVTTACHHCVEPACLEGCPVKAYEKDPVTGVVRHLDDQCIGCRYCTLTCPYEVPRYNARLGIVRKCDMCAGRLDAGEAPACVQACPNEAIAIEVVEQAEMVGRAESGPLVPGAASSGLSIPTTTYATSRPMPKTARPADLYRVRPAPNHGPLAVMLVLTQASVGAFVLDWFLSLFWSGADGTLRARHAAVALATGLVALGASVLHLGRPALAFRALLGLGTSWLSREILVFGLFAALASLYAGLAWMGPLGLWPTVAGPQASAMAVAGAAVCLAGVLGVSCSVMLYRVTGKALWNGPSTGIKFGLSSLLLGAAVSLAVHALTASAGAGVHSAIGVLVAIVATSTTIKLLYEAGLLIHLKAPTRTELKRSALLWIGPLRAWTLTRFGIGTAGGILVPLLFWAERCRMGRSLLSVMLVVLAVTLVLVGELCERSLFFKAVSSPRMPGGPNA